MSALIDFLRTVLPKDGWYMFSCKPKGKGRWKNTPVQTIEELASHATIYNGKGYDTYFGVYAYKGDKSPTGKVRDAENVRVCKCFVMDIDCGEGKPYANQQAGLLALVDFLKGTKIPKPTYLVRSGFGLHVYWVLDVEVPPDKHTKVASDLINVATHYGLQIDRVVTADLARVLRPIETNNYKHDTPAPVTLQHPKQGISPTLVSAVAFIRSVKGLRPKKKCTNNDDLIGDVEYPPSDAERIADQCAFFKDMRDTKGEYQSEPEWYAAISVLIKTQQGAAVAHDWSSGYSGYDEGECDRKIAQIESKDMGPIKCETLRGMSGKCEGCSLTCTSPISLGWTKHQAVIRDEEGDEEVLPELPEAMRDSKGNYKFFFEEGVGLIGVKKFKVKDEVTGKQKWETKEVVCSPQFIYVSFLWKDLGDDGDDFMARVCRREGKGKWHESDIKLSVFGQGGSALAGQLAGRSGIINSDLSNDLLVEYMKTWAMEQRRRNNVKHMCLQQGWQEDGSFVLGTTCYRPNGTKVEVMLPKNASNFVSHLKAKGSLDRYVAIIDKLYNQPDYERYQFVWLSAFGSTIINLIEPDPSGMIISAYGTATGAGKSAVAKAGMAVWGDPAAFGQMAVGNNATPLSLFTMAGIRHNLPMFLDETTEWPADKLGDFIYTYSAGRAKTQALPNGQLRDNSRLNWSNFCYLTSNRMASNVVYATRANSEAIAARIFEVEFPQISFDGRNQILTTAINANSGGAGIKFIERIITKKDLVIKGIRHYQTKLREIVGNDPRARFWINIAACNLAAFDVTKACGLHSFNREAFQAWVYEELQNMAVGLSGYSASSEESLEAMIRAFSSGIIRTMDEGDNAIAAKTEQGYSAKSLQFSSNINNPRGILGRFIVSKNSYYFATKDVQRWCASKGIDSKVFRRELEATGLLSPDRKLRYNLGKGTVFSTDRVYCWKIQYPTGAVVPSTVRKPMEEEDNDILDFDTLQAQGF